MLSLSSRVALTPWQQAARCPISFLGKGQSGNRSEEGERQLALAKQRTDGVGWMAKRCLPKSCSLGSGVEREPVVLCE